MIRKNILALILAWLVIAPAAADDAPTVMFDRKYFTDVGNFVGVEGSPTGEGASSDTTRWVLWCYQESRECFQIIITASGRFVSILTPIPITYTVKVWAADRIVAQRDLACGLQETWLLDRLRQTAEFFGATCLGRKFPPWTIEDPPSWKKAMERLGEQKPSR
jgi:hypothetical protein